MVIYISGLQIHYLSSSNTDGSDNDCERYGWNRLQDYSPVQSTWKYLNELAEEGSMPDEDFSLEELGDDDYYPSLPFAALFSICKVMINVLYWTVNNLLACFTNKHDQFVYFVSTLCWLSASMSV